MEDIHNDILINETTSRHKAGADKIFNVASSDSKFGQYSAVFVKRHHNTEWNQGIQQWIDGFCKDKFTVIVELGDKDGTLNTWIELKSIKKK